MRLRAQIVRRFAVLPLFFAAAVVISTGLALDVRQEVMALATYHVPIARRMANLEVAGTQYQLWVEYLLTTPPGAPTRLAEAERELANDREQIETDLREALALLERAIADERLGVKERVALAEVHGTFRLLASSVLPFLTVASEAIDAWKAGRPEDARTAVDGFRPVGTQMVDELVSMREALSKLERKSVAWVYRSLAALSWIGIGLFVLATGLAMAFGAAFARRVSSRLRTLIDASKDVGESQYDVTLPPAGDDEVGELTNSFAAMLDRLREEKRINDAFGRYFDPRIVTHVLSHGGDPGDHAERTAASIFFADVSGFTGISEQLTAETLVRVLNRIFTGAADAIRARGGVVDKYIGDAVMAFFMSPFAPAQGHAAAACLAALDHLEALQAMAPELAQLTGLRRGAPLIQMRVGIATGEVVAGTLGAPSARSFTVIGDAVNAASRITGVARVYDVRILVAGETWRLAQSEIEAREIDCVVVSGKSEDVRLYEVLGGVGTLTPADQERVEMYAKALALYRAQGFVEAESAFARCVERFPTDGPARLMQKRCAALRTAPPPEDWNGVWVLGGK